MHQTQQAGRKTADNRRQRTAESVAFHLFPSELGWMGLCWHDTLVVRFSFGHASAVAACQTIDEAAACETTPHGWVSDLVHQLQDFSTGGRVEFSGVPIDERGFTKFRCRVTHACRKIAWGSTLSYGHLAAQAGSPRAARAVGNVMANNPFPVIVPCHRVLAAHSLGGYSASSGLQMKRRLLAQEGFQGQ